MTCANRCLFCFPPTCEVIEETKNFRVLVDIHPLTKGHIMITSRAHVLCAAEISDVAEYLELKNKYMKKVKKQYGKVGMYEHGRVGMCNLDGGGECEHFHLHILPIDDISAKITHKNVLPAIKIEDHTELVQNYRKYPEYLYFDDDSREYFYPVKGEIPSSFIRTIIANYLGKPELADWHRIL